MDMLSKKLKDKLEALETPFYLYDMDLLKRTLDSLSSEALKHNYHLHYAIKANADPRVLDAIRSRGLGIDCASGNEIKCAIKAGFKPETIVFAGVGKKDSELRYAISQHIFSINCESIEEMRVLDKLSEEAGKRTRVAIRVNPDISAQTNKCIDTGQADCKFGISYEEVLSNIEELKSLAHLDIRGIHIHIGSQIRDFSVFELLCDKVNIIYKTLLSKGLKLEFVDVGGGLGVNYDCPEDEPIPDFAKVFGITSKRLDVGNCEVHFEFGRSVVAQCGELITRVLFNKTTATGRKLVIVDSSMTELIRPALYGAVHNIENISAKASDRHFYTVVGTACESTDVLGEHVELPETKRGDILTIKTTGAYGQSMASRYNQHDLPRSVYSDEL